jgi:hypothetical protein
MSQLKNSDIFGCTWVNWLSWLARCCWKKVQEKLGTRCAPVVILGEPSFPDKQRIPKMISHIKSEEKPIISWYSMCNVCTQDRCSTQIYTNRSFLVGGVNPLRNIEKHRLKPPIINQYFLLHHPDFPAYSSPLSMLSRKRQTEQQKHWFIFLVYPPLISPIHHWFMVFTIKSS